MNGNFGALFMCCFQFVKVIKYWEKRETFNYILCVPLRKEDFYFFIFKNIYISWQIVFAWARTHTMHECVAKVVAFPFYFSWFLKLLITACGSAFETCACNYFLLLFGNKLMARCCTEFDWKVQFLHAN